MTAMELKQKRMYTGVVVSDGMDKTVVVKAERAYIHKVFKKTIRTAKKYKVHDEKELAVSW